MPHQHQRRKAQKHPAASRPVSYLRCHVLAPHVQQVDGQICMLEPGLSGIVTLPDDKQTKTCIKKGWLKVCGQEKVYESLPKPDTVLMRCLKQGCPRTKRVRRSLLEAWVPKKAVELHTYCPWHDARCDKGNPEYYFDKKGRRLDWETGKPSDLT